MVRLRVFAVEVLVTIPASLRSLPSRLLALALLAPAAATATAVTGCGDDGGDDGGGGGDPLGVTLVDPADGAFLRDQTLMVRVETTGAPDRVAFLVDDVERDVFGPTGVLDWATSSFADGAHVLVAEAQRGGETVRSAAVNVTIDKVAPTLVGRAPEAGSDVFELTGDIVAEFDEPVRAADPDAAVSVIAETQSCPTPPCAEIPLDVTVTFDDDAEALVARLTSFPPSAFLPVDLRVRVGNGVTDRAGNPLVTEGMAGSWAFGAPAWVPFGARVVLGTSILESGDGPTLTVGPDGTPYVLWLGSDPVDLSDDVRLFSYEGFWALEGQAAQALGLDVEATDLAVAASGDVYVAMGGRRVAGGPLVAVRRWDGTSFLDLPDPVPAILSGEPEGTQVVNVEVAVGAAEEADPLLLVETLGDDATRRVRAFRHDGADWVALGGDVPGGGADARLAVDSRGRALVASLRPVEGSDDADVLVHRHDEIGGAWEQLGDALFHGGGAFAFAVDVGDRPFVAVRQGLASLPWVLDGDGWERLPGPGVEGGAPALAFDGDGVLVLGTTREAARWEPDGTGFLFDTYGDPDVEAPPEATPGLTLGLAPNGLVLRGASDFRRELQIFRFNEPLAPAAGD